MNSIQHEASYTDSAYRMYLREISAYRPLSQDEERSLFLRAGAGDREAREMIIKANLKLVVHIAGKAAADGLVSMEDLVQYGNIGLMHAVDKYESGKGTKFGTYAYYWIKQAVMRGKYSSGPAIRLPAYLMAQLIKLHSAEDDLREEFGRDPTDEEIMAKTGFAAKDIRKIRSLPLNILSLNTPANDEEDSDEVIDFIPAGKEREPQYAFEQKSMHAALKNAVEALPERTRKVIAMRYGFDGGKPKTLEEVGNVIGVTKERVRQIESQALHTLAGSDELKDYAS